MSCLPFPAPRHCTWFSRRSSPHRETRRLLSRLAAFPSPLLLPVSSAPTQPFCPLPQGFIDRGFTATHLEQMVPVVDRLRAGLPVTVVGVGSSIMSDHGGCFHRSPELLGQGYAKFRGSAGPCDFRGFAAGFMVELNNSYPHDDHLFVNLGIAGTDLEHFARRNCFGAELPSEARGPPSGPLSGACAARAWGSAASPPSPLEETEQARPPPPASRH